jgi:phosphatidate phosphatase APP1
MKLFNWKSLMMSTLLLSSVAVNAAQVVVVSDIDDTVKRSTYY